MGVHIREGYHGNLIVEYVNERGVSHPFCTLLKNGESYQIYISPRVSIMSVEEFFDACYDIEEHIDDYESEDITVPNFSSLTQKGIDELKSRGITLVSKPSLEDKLDDEMLKHRDVIDTHYIPFTKQQLLDLHDSLCETRTNNQGMYQKEVEDLITYLDYQIDKLP